MQSKTRYIDPADIEVTEVIVKSTSNAFDFVPARPLSHIVAIELVEVLVRGYPTTLSIPDSAFFTVVINQVAFNVVGPGATSARSASILIPLKDTVTHHTYTDRMVWQSKTPFDLLKIDGSVADSSGVPATLSDLVIVLRVYRQPSF